MSVWALVPARSFADGKSRLGPALDATARRELARRLFHHVMQQLAGVVDGVLVCTDSDEVAEAAARHGARVHRDPPEAKGLAAVVDGGLRSLAADGALVLMADLPLLTGEDVRQLVARMAEHPVVLVRAQDGRHTNALGLSPPTAFPTAFGGAESFAAHLVAAREAGLRACVVDNPRVAFDVDEPRDLDQIRASSTTGISRPLAFFS